jgi:chaperonin GroES
MRLENGKRIAPEVKPGDKILFGKYAGTDLKIDGDEVLLVREDEVLAVQAKDGEGV